jgi:hypothetical protein
MYPAPPHGGPFHFVSLSRGTPWFPCAPSPTRFLRPAVRSPSAAVIATSYDPGRRQGVALPNVCCWLRARIFGFVRCGALAQYDKVGDCFPPFGQYRTESMGHPTLREGLSGSPPFSGSRRLVEISSGRRGSAPFSAAFACASCPAGIASGCASARRSAQSCRQPGQQSETKERDQGR